MIDISGRILEATNATILVLFGFMLLAAVMYFVRLVTKSHRSLRAIYVESKASFAATILFMGMFLRQGAIWWPRHVVEHGGHLDWYPTHIFNTIIIVTSLPILWGSICWMRVTMPLRCHPWAWVVVAFAAIGFGLLSSAM